MTLSVAIQMDPLDPIDIEADSSFVLGLEAQKRGHTLYHYLPNALSFRHGDLLAVAHPLSLQRKVGDHFSLGEAETLDLSAIDVVLMRQDPPFDMSYITATHFLEQIHPATLVVNDPHEVRNAPEKIFVTRYPDLMPPTLITRDRAEIDAFRREYRDIMIKPLFGNGGAGVFHLPPGDENLGALFEIYLDFFREPMIVQQYLPEVREGDKRIILVDGKARGGVLRVPAEGEARANMHVGATPIKTEITRRDLEICEALGPELRKRGLIFVGIDVIGDYLTEINVTSPTGIQEINRFDGVTLEAEIWDAIENRLP